MKSTAGYLALQTASATPIVNFQTDFQKVGDFKEESDNRGIFLKCANYMGHYSGGAWHEVDANTPCSSVFMQYNHKNNVEVAVATVMSGNPAIDSALKGNFRLIRSVARKFFLVTEELSRFLNPEITEPAWKDVRNALAKKSRYYGTTTMCSELWRKTMTAEEAKKLLKALKCKMVLPS